jgi:hypothetical protein
MLRKIVIIKKNAIIYKREYGETFTWECIAPLFMSLTYFVEEAPDEVPHDILNTVFYKIGYSTNKKLNLLFIFVTDINDPDEVIANQLQDFNKNVSALMEAV